jgi:ankyrin repeat protein
MAAAVCGKLDLVNLLLAQGAAPDLTTKRGLSALHFAIAHRHDRIIDRLIKAGSKASGLSLFGPIQRGDLPTIKRLIRAGADVNVQGNAAAGAIAGQKPLEAAVLERCRIDSEIRLKLTEGSGGSVAAKQRGYLEIIKALIQGGAKLNGPTRWRSPLLVAASGGDLVLVKFLIKAGADPNAATSVALLERGRSALHNAALGGFAEIVEILIAAGSDVNKRDAEGRSPLQIVREQEGSMEMMMAEVAISHGVEKTQEELDAMRKNWQERRARIIAILERNARGSQRTNFQ